MKSFVAKPHEVEKKWYVVDATDKPLGRLASQVAGILRGKHKPIFTPHVDTGDFVIIINTDKVKLTGKKLDQKMYRWHTGYPGGLKERTYREMMATKSDRIVYEAVKGMIPHNKLGRQVIKKLKVCKGAEHNHQAQMPEDLDIQV